MRTMRWFGLDGATAGGLASYTAKSASLKRSVARFASLSWSSSSLCKRSRCKWAHPRTRIVTIINFCLFSEFVRSHKNLMKYNCDQKLEFIKKGMGEFVYRCPPCALESGSNAVHLAEKYRTSKKNMSNFPGDVVKAEKLTNGNVNILQAFETPTKKPAATQEKSFTETSPTVPFKKAAGAYNSASKVQVSTTPESKSDRKFTCTMCDFSTDRMNLLMFHIKNHSSTSTSLSPRPSGKITFSSCRDNDCSLKSNLDLSPVVEVKRAAIIKSPFKKFMPQDSIADDVRKIKESMEPKPSTSAKKTRQPQSAGRPRNAKKEVAKEVVEEPVAKVEQTKAINDLLADWLDEEDEIDFKKGENLNFTFK